MLAWTEVQLPKASRILRKDLDTAALAKTPKQLRILYGLQHMRTDSHTETEKPSRRREEYLRMASTHRTLDAASSERKARLAKLASLKRKQPGSDTTPDTPSAPEDSSAFAPPSKADVYLSGRNYDPATRGPKLGFENVPSANTTTLEQQAERITLSTAEQAAKDEAEVEKGIDLFKLQPKKPNWDLKRDLAEKMKILDVRTQNAIARLVRERIENSKKEALQKSKGKEEGGSGEEVGIDGSTLVQGVHVREIEEQEDERRERERDEEDGIA